MRIICIVMLLFTVNCAKTQEFSGSWYGQFDIPGIKLRIAFNIEKTADGYQSTMDSPDEKVVGMATTSTVVDNNKLHIILKSIQAEYKGEFKDGEIIGTYSQRGNSIKLDLTREKNFKVIEQKTRIQDPKKPFDYHVEEVAFINNEADGIKLAGTLTIPNDIDRPPVVILISGSGPQNRNEEVYNHRPFHVWADHLAKNGIAALRYDDRGVAGSEGNYAVATIADFATDTNAAYQYLRTRSDVINTQKIGMMGHSEGGLIASITAAQERNVAFVVLLAAPGVEGAEISLSQITKAAEMAGLDKQISEFNYNISKSSFDIIKQEDDNSTVKKRLTENFIEFREMDKKLLSHVLSDDFIAAQVKELTTPWSLHYFRTNPHEFVSRIQAPVLALNGVLDVQVLPDLNLKAIERSLTLAENKDFTIKRIKNLNHLFQQARTGHISEYENIEETVNNSVLELVSSWINKRFGG